ncbi:MAG: M15 family metallopeptidase [Myxococcales bacterium]|nr:M15 family metallopeptidase [Myxococcales bacterium]
MSHPKGEWERPAPTSRATKTKTTSLFRMKKPRKLSKRGETTSGVSASCSAWLNACALQLGLGPGMFYSDCEHTAILIEAGWKWGGNWDSPKDYHHFFIE